MKNSTILIGMILILYFLFNGQAGRQKLVGLVVSLAGIWCFDTTAKYYNIVAFLNGSLTTLTAFCLAIIILLDYKGVIKNPKKIMGVTSIVSGILSFIHVYQISKVLLYIKSELSNFSETKFYGPVFYILVNVLVGALLLICGIRAILNMNIKVNPKIFIPVIVMAAIVFANVYVLFISSYVSAIELPHDLALFAQGIVYPLAILLTFNVYSNNQVSK